MIFGIYIFFNSLDDNNCNCIDLKDNYVTIVVAHCVDQSYAWVNSMIILSKMQYMQIEIIKCRSPENNENWMQWGEKIVQWNDYE